MLGGAKVSNRYGAPPIAIGGLCGGASGLVTARLGVQPFITTLAMMVFARGLAKYASGGMKISRSIGDRFADLPPLFAAIDKRILWDNVSMVSVIFAVCVLMGWLALARHTWGRRL